MLLLSRKASESIRVGESVTILVSHHDRHGVTLTIRTATPGVPADAPAAEVTMRLEVGRSCKPAEDVYVKLVRCDKDRAVLGVDAPIEIPVHRGEVHDRLSRESPDGVVRPGGRRNLGVERAERAGVVVQRGRREGERSSGDGYGSGDVVRGRVIGGGFGVGLDDAGWGDQGNEHVVIH